MDMYIASTRLNLNGVKNGDITPVAIMLVSSAKKRDKGSDM